MQERRRQGLCYNCDEQYVRGHVCPRLFYLEADDFAVDKELPAEDAVPAVFPEELHVDGAHAHAIVVSLCMLLQGSRPTTRCYFR